MKTSCTISMPLCCISILFKIRGLRANGSTKIKAMLPNSGNVIIKYFLDAFQVKKLDLGCSGSADFSSHTEDHRKMILIQKTC